jgi:branched-chain amino acid transport system substrate-binding protein
MKSSGLSLLMAGALAFTGTASAHDITLGASISLTGKYSTAGSHTKNGYDLAIKKINDAGGVKFDGKSHMLVLKVYDDESTPARATELAERLIQRDNVKLMLGPYSSGLTKAIAPVTEKHGIPMVEGNGASRSLFNQGYKYLFAVLSTSEQYLQEAVNLLAEKTKAAGGDVTKLKIAVATENDPFSQDIRAGILEDAERHGMQVVVDDKLPRELSDMSSTLTKVKALKPDLLVTSGHSKGAVLAVKQMAEMQVNVPMHAMTHCESAKVDDMEKFGNNADYVLCAGQWAPTLSYSDSLFGSASDYAKEFEAVYDYVPPYQAAESSAAVMVFADALQRAGSTDTAAVRDALAATDMQTFYGNVKFDDTGKNIAKPMVLRQIKDGKYSLVAPTDWANAELIYPRPTWAER